MGLRLCVLASGSSGNCTYVASRTTAILIDAGISVRVIEERLARIGASIEDISVVCVTHEHGDHVGGLGTLHELGTMPLYANLGTLRGLHDKDGLSEVWVNEFRTGEPFRIGDLVINAFPVQHDTEEPVGFVVTGCRAAVGVATELGEATATVREHLRTCDTVELDVPTRAYRTPRVYEQKVTVAGGHFRQLYLQDLGHDQPTILLTNEPTASAKQLLTRYAQRMLIENALSDAVRFFHLDALSSAVGLKVDFDMALLVVASGLYRLLARRMRGYAEAQARHLFRDLIQMPAEVTIDPPQVTVRFHRRAHLPIVIASGLLDQPVSVPWWNGATLRLTT